MIPLGIGGTGRCAHTVHLHRCGFLSSHGVSALISELGCMMDGVGHRIGVGSTRCPG
jgi:hypothetical protein